MQLSDWADRWRDGRIAFHQTAVSDFLERYADQVWEGRTPARVLVPLCGKSLDMVFLAGRADEVIGVEYAEQAVEEFFVERGLAPEVRTDPPVSYRAGPYTLYAADFFAVTRDHLGVIHGAFHRASLVALDAATRVRYADHVRSLLPAGTRTLLITFDYDQASMAGPPFAVSDAEVRRLFEDGFDVRELDTREVLDEQFRARGLSWMSESAFVLTRRPGR